MSKFIMLGMTEEHGKFLYDLVKKELDTIDVIQSKECYGEVAKDMDGWLKQRRKLAEEAKELLSFVF